MLSVPDIAIIGAVALLVFGPEQLPRVARKVGTIMRDVQNTSNQFIREMERAADDHDHPVPHPIDPATYDPYPAPDLGLHPDYETPLPGLEAASGHTLEPAIPKKPPSEPSEY